VGRVPFTAEVKGKKSKDNTASRNAIITSAVSTCPIHVAIVRVGLFGTDIAEKTIANTSQGANSTMHDVAQ
jgi:hypothetical protein